MQPLLGLREGCTGVIASKFKFKLLVILLVTIVKPLLFKQHKSKQKTTEEPHKGLWSLYPWA